MARTAQRGEQQHLVLDADKAGSMNNRVDPALHEVGMLREGRNFMRRVGRWDRRGGWKKLNATRMPWKHACGAYAYTDTQGTQHIVVVADDGNIYHDLNWAEPVVLHDEVFWDGSYTASFAPWGDHLFIALGALTGTSQNIRYDGIRGEAYGVSLAAPTHGVDLADGGEGNIAEGDFLYKVVFVDALTGLPSDESPVAAITLEDPAEEPDPEAPFLRKINITSIPIYQGTGRTIHRRIYRSDNGEAYILLATITNNFATTYIDNNEFATGATYVQHQPVPVCSQVGVNSDGVVVWANDKQNGEPATVYVGFAVEGAQPNPEALSDIQFAGTHDDPITGVFGVRDGAVLMKRRSIYWLPRLCKDCERMVEGVGCVAWATIQNVGNQIAFLSAEGPRIVSHSFEEDVRFVGPDPRRFCLAETWENVVKDRLPYATSVHWPSRNIIAWAVQMCEVSFGYGAKYGQHNDTLIVWNYATQEVELHDLLVDAMFKLPVEGSEEDQPWGAFPLGFVGQLWEGQHGDGVDEMMTGNIVQQTGTTVWVDESEWELEGSGLVGSVLHIDSGTGTRTCRDIDPCDRPNTLIVSYYGGTLELATEVSLDETSHFWIGGFGYVVDLMIDGGDPDSIKQFLRAEVQMKGA